MRLSKQLHVDVGNVYIDGVGFGDISERILTERDTLARDGIILISALVSNESKELISDIQVMPLGVFSSARRAEAVEICIKTIIETIQIMGPSYLHYKNIQRIRASIRRRIARHYDKNPAVVINFIQVDARELVGRIRRGDAIESTT